MCQPLIRSLFLSRREMALKFCRFPWIKHAISWCYLVPAKTVCWVASIFFCPLASRTPHTFSTSLWKCKSMVAKSLNSMERYMPSTACPWLLRCAAPDKSFSIGGQVGSGQVRPARQWRARFRAQAQKAQYVHNCYLHVAEIDKWN